MSSTVFLRLLGVEDKAAALLAAAKAHGPSRLEVNCDAFSKVPTSPFAYWVSGGALRLFVTHDQLESEPFRIARRTNSVDNDFRYVRLTYECALGRADRLVPWAKGGVISKFYAPIPTSIFWSTGRQSFPGFLGTNSRPLQRPASSQHFFRPGLTWPRRTSSLCFRVLPSGCIFGDKSPALFIEQDSTSRLLAICAVTNSAPFSALVALQLARTELAQSFEVGLIQQTPLPTLSPQQEAVLAEAALRAWSNKRKLDEIAEQSHAFHLPAQLTTGAWTLTERAANWATQTAAIERELVAIQSIIDESCFKLYGLSDDDRQAIERGFGSSPMPTSDESNSDGDDEPDEDATPSLDPASLTAQLLSYTIGTALGRFDIRLATGERPLPPEPDPFDPLPACSPGMLTDSAGLPVTAPPPGYPIPFPTDGILVDDPGHDRDLLARIHQVFTVLFASDADDRLAEAVSILDPSAQTLRPWLRRTFFEEHIQRYSKSRRKAPIYWRLGTPSGSYSVWIYIHRFNKDTLHRVLNDHVAPKLRYESSKLATLQSEAGPSPAPSQRKALAEQETLVDELQALRAELDRVAPLWDPDLDDGVVINASFLHRLFAHTRAWQKECESHWQKLQKGEYDWAHLAMRLWPERVVPKCADDRSLAIAHGLEDVLWQEEPDGKWRPLPVTDAEIAALVQERTRPAVKDALRKMGEVPEPAPARKARAVAPEGEPKAPKKPKAVKGPEAVQLGLGLPDDATPADLNAVRAALHGAEDGLAKADLLGGCGLDESAAAAALAALVQSGEVVKIGAGRGTRYRLGGEG